MVRKLGHIRERIPWIEAQHKDSVVPVAAFLNGGQMAKDVMQINDAARG